MDDRENRGGCHVCHSGRRLLCPKCCVHRGFLGSAALRGVHQRKQRLLERLKGSLEAEVRLRSRLGPAHLKEPCNDLPHARCSPVLAALAACHSVSCFLCSIWAIGLHSTPAPQISTPSHLPTHGAEAEGETRCAAAAAGGACTGTQAHLRQSGQRRGGAQTRFVPHVLSFGGNSGCVQRQLWEPLIDALRMPYAQCSARRRRCVAATGGARASWPRRPSRSAADGCASALHDCSGAPVLVLKMEHGRGTWVLGAYLSAEVFTHH